MVFQIVTDQKCRIGMAMFGEMPMVLMKTRSKIATVYIIRYDWIKKGKK